MHCFSSGETLAKGVGFRFYISFSGICAIAAEILLDRILVETDAPYLAPTPHRGSLTEPAHCTHTGKISGNTRLAVRSRWRQ